MNRAIISVWLGALDMIKFIQNGEASQLPTQYENVSNCKTLMVESSKSPFQTYRFVPLKIRSIEPVLKPIDP